MTDITTTIEMQNLKAVDLDDFSSMLAEKRHDTRPAPNAFPISVETIRASIRSYELTELDGGELLWLRSFAHGNNKSITEISTLLKKRSGECYSKDTVYQAMTGVRQGGLTAFIDSVRELRKQVEKSNTPSDISFVETTQAKVIFRACDRSRDYGRIVFIYGPSHCGKTTAFMQYRRLQPFGKVVYVRMPTGGYKQSFVHRLGMQLGAGNCGNNRVMGERVIALLNDTMLLIVDETTECFRSWKLPRVDTLNWIRELHDLTGVAIVLSGTGTAREGLEKGLHKDMFTELRRRGMRPISLAGQPSAKDLNAFAAQIGLPPATGEALDLQTLTVARDSLGTWLTLLRAAKRVSERLKTEPTWDMVLKVEKTFSEEESAK